MQSVELWPDEVDEGTKRLQQTESPAPPASMLRVAASRLRCSRRAGGRGLSGLAFRGSLESIRIEVDNFYEASLLKQVLLQPLINLTRCVDFFTQNSLYEM